VQAAPEALVNGLVADEGDGQRGLQQGLAERAQDLCRGLSQTVEDAHHARVDVVVVGGAARGGVSGEPEQMVTLLHGHAEPAGERADDLLGGMGTARLFESAVVVDRHVAEHGDLLAA
jgi:hypothetical protein